jgi:hypothetical protein
MFWRSMAGVIGYDVISRFVVTVDYDDSVVVLHDPATWKYTGTEKPLSMVMNGPVPALQGKFDDADEGLFRLDDRQQQHRGRARAVRGEDRPRPPHGQDDPVRRRRLRRQLFRARWGGCAA